MNALPKELKPGHTLKEALDPGRVIVKLDLPYKLNEADKTQFPKPELVSAWLIRSAINMKFKDATPLTDSRICALVQDQLFSEPKNLSLSKSEFEWFFAIVSGCDYPGAISSWRMTLLKSLEELNRQL